MAVLCPFLLAFSVRPLRLQGAGYRRFKDPFDVRFNAGTTIVLGDVRDDPKTSSNGSGKSTILNAIFWAIWGEEPHGGKSNDIINHQANEVWVELELGDSPTEPAWNRLLIRRLKQRQASEKLEFWHKGQHVEGHRDVVQARLLEIVGLSVELAKNTLYISRRGKASKFLQETPSKRAQLLEEMIADARLFVAEELAKGALKVIDDQSKEADRDRLSLDRELLSVRQDILTVQAQIQQAAQQHQNAREAQQRRLDTLRDELLALQQQHAEAVDLEPLSLRKNQVQAELLRIRALVAGREAMSGGRDLSSYPACPECLRPLSADILASRQTILNAYRIEIRQMKETEQGLLAEDRQVTAGLQTLQQQLQRHSMAQQAIGMKAQEVQAAEMSLSQQADPTLGFRQMLSDKQRREQEIGLQQLQLSQHQDVLTFQREQYKVWLEAFGRKGLRNLMLDDLRAQLAFYSHRHLFQLAGTRMSLVFPQGVLTGKGTLSEVFEIVVRTEEAEQDLCMFSDGEFWRAAFSVLLGLGDALMHGTRTPLKFRLIDDIEGDLDPAGRREFLLACEQLSQYHPVIITMPQDPIAAIPATLLRVVRHGWTSRVEAT